MACLWQIVIVVIFNGLYSTWMGMAYPLNNVVQVNKRDPSFDLDRLNAVASHSNCYYELVDTAKIFKTGGEVEWYPKMRPVAKCTSGDCHLVSMRLLFLVKHKQADTFESYWGQWDVSCSKSTSRIAKAVEFQRNF